MNLPTALDAHTLYANLLDKIRRAYPQSTALAIAGIYSGGAWLAQRLAQDLQIQDVGYINVALHRDDYASKGMHRGTQPTSLPFDVNAREILLIDDVFYSGRTTRAAINEIFDFGRPARITLAVLVDRTELSTRQLPYTVDLSGIHMVLPADQILALQQSQDGLLTFALESI
ncbi:MAG: bifunctional pyr operon transcriptional regulator/uracil phosphoribosyltransferase PyrR [Ottowia sp.]|nr:bifunctional pyr operon transcriptional regulator/uracil phosphoribosyltransferase PyrR [Ottowia sp.]